MQRVRVLQSGAFTRFRSGVWRAGAALLVALGALIGFRPEVAVAGSGTCSGTSGHDWISEYYVPSDGNVAGSRSPIILRTTGTVCDSGFSSPWVAVISADSSGGTGAGIAQIGWDHEGVTGFCRFWEYNNNKPLGSGGYDSGPVDYNCGGDPHGTTVYFKVALWADTNTNRYGMFDCGTSDFSTCTRKSDGPVRSWLGNVDIQDAQEAFPASSTNCENYFMGSPTRPINFTHLEAQLTQGGGWSDQNFSYNDSAGCGHYESGTHTNTVFQTDDDRN